MLADCHLGPSWFPSMERVCEEINNREKVHENFRLWITTRSTNKFPVAILDKSIKIAFEATESVREDMLKLLRNTSD